MAGEWDDVLSALGLETSPSEAAGEATAVPSALQTQVAGFPARGANMLMGALGPLGEAGMTLGEMLRTRSFDSRMLPQIAGGVLLGTAAPGGLETGTVAKSIPEAEDILADIRNMLKGVGIGENVVKGYAPAVAPLTEEAIAAKLAANPGASIFDLAGTHVGGASMPLHPQEEKFNLGTFPREIPFDVPPQAAELGFTQPALHGTQVPWSSWSVPGEGPQRYYPQAIDLQDALRLPDYELGVHFGNPKQASMFAGDTLRQQGLTQPRTYPTVLQTGSSLELPDLGSWEAEKVSRTLSKLNKTGTATGVGGTRVNNPDLIGVFPPEELDKINDIGDLRQYLYRKGYDSVKYINGVEDRGSPSYIMFKPSPQAPEYVSGVRSPFAKFDPNKLSWPELAAGLAGVGAIPALAHEEGQQE